MSKRKRGATVITAFILLILLTGHAAYTRRRAQIAEIEADVSDIRGLERLQETTLAFRTRAQIKAERAAPAEETPSPNDDMERFIAFYRALDLAPPELDLAAAFGEFRTANVLGFYNFEENVITLLREPGMQFAPLTFFERFTYAHEFMHVLQDQHYDLKQLWERVGASENFDLALATSALIEGDADAVELEILKRLLTRMSDRELDYRLRQTEQAITVLGASKHVPAIIKAASVFPYEQGKEFVASLVESAGWESLHQVFTSDPPRSTEQIYHPERYLAGDEPSAISLPDFSEVIGEGARQVYDSAVGEFYLRQHLATRLGDDAARAAADGWGGDRMALFIEDASGELLWVWRLVWDSPADASEFSETYREYLDVRFAGIAAEGSCWTAIETGCFARISETETRISMAANRATALALLQLDS